MLSNVTSTSCGTENSTAHANWTAECGVEGDRNRPMTNDFLHTTMVVADGVIFVVGLIGNLLVIYVVARYARMKTVTNVYILNLSIADSLFLLGMPMIMTTALLRRWVFGAVLCHVFLVLTCINMFTGTFTLALMSADRFVAVWFPVSSARFRTPTVAAGTAAVAWIVSGFVMSPVVFNAEHRAQLGSDPPKYSCQVNFPAKHYLSAARAYVGYTFVLGFLLPVGSICVFYALLVARLRSSRRRVTTKTAKRQGSGRRSVTCFVATITGVFICCWLPYWIFQVCVVFRTPGPLHDYVIFLFQFFSILSYANSAVNPFLYAFTNDAFKSAFADAFRCTNASSARSWTTRLDDPTKPRCKRTAAAVSASQATVVDGKPCRGQGNHSVRLELVALSRENLVCPLPADGNLMPPAAVVSADMDDVNNGTTTCVTVYMEPHHKLQDATTISDQSVTVCSERVVLIDDEGRLRTAPSLRDLSGNCQHLRCE